MSSTPLPLRKETVSNPLPRLVFLGNSVLLAGIKADLKTSGQVQAITVDAQDPDAADLIGRHEPTAVIFDLHAERLDVALALLQNRPGVLLIGVAASSDQALLLSGQQVKALSVSDLLELVQSQTHDPAT